MKSFNSLLAAAAFLLILTAPCVATEDGAGRAEKILDYVDDLYRSSSSHGVITMKIVTEHWSRELKLEEWSMGEDFTLLRILAPKKEKGTATLRRKNEIWNYLPKVNRVIKLPSSMMSDSWMGSHFTNDDLVKETRMTEDYDFEITSTGKRVGAAIIKITCHPHADAAVVWGKVLVVVRAENHIPIEIEYFDEDLELARTMEFKNVMQLGGRRIPSTMIVTPADKPGEHTEVIYNEIEFNVDLDESLFSLRNLKK